VIYLYLRTDIPAGSAFIRRGGGWWARPPDIKRRVVS
jgi:hypothetical protein